ncbi:phage tail protein [Fodinicurvata sp. EGI_FJ10296]|uniref:phage tail protein n=1 Tax=Fodinicurvata sp. EGI_FJ10296 TaxID=3231908 RepID=UPI0034514DA4
MPLMALGDYRFELGTAAYQSLERGERYRWQAQDRLGRRPAQQFTGPDAPEIKLDGVIYPYHRGGLGQVDAMRAMASRGEPLDMVDGTGRVWGLWCITEVTETQTHFHPDGSPRKVEFGVRLVCYGEDTA